MSTVAVQPTLTCRRHQSAVGKLHIGQAAIRRSSTATPPFT